MRTRGLSLTARLAAFVLVGGGSLLTGALLPAGHATEETRVDRDSGLKVLLVLDVSGSMRRPGGSGGTLLQGAKQALSELVYSLPESTEVGLRAYGSEYGGTNRKQSCSDSRLLVPVQPLQPREIVGAARGLRPTGDTPIGYALQRAGSDLSGGEAERRVVVLISDGEDNCSPPGPPPCQVARGLERSDVALRVETVGVALQGQRRARDSLRCIAERTGGNYYDAKNADALAAALERIARETLGKLGPGQQVQGGSLRGSGPLLEPGAYRFRIRPEGVNWFRFAVEAGEQPRILATVQGLASLNVPRRAQNCPSWRVELYNPYGEGGVYAPYGNSGVFDGVGYGTTGASSSARAERYPFGIDYVGEWAVQLSLAEETIDTCSEHLPENAVFDARFSIQTGEGSEAEVGKPSATATAGENAGQDGDAGSDAARKYDQPFRQGTPAWVMPVVAVSAVLLAGVVGAVGYRLYRRRRRGW